jgi:secreted PhoX family phosphatase
VAVDVFQGVNADGLGNRIIGTGYNCSGATTPWATFLSAEENFQGSSAFYVGVQEDVLPNGSQTSYVLKAPLAKPLVWWARNMATWWKLTLILSIPSRKHTALGRFRHENATIRAEAGQSPGGLHG